MQLLSVNGVAANGMKARTADPEAGRSNGTDGASALQQLEHESMSPTAGLRQEKVPLSDDHFWDGA